CRHPSQLWGGAAARLLCGIASQGNEDRDGASDLSSKDRGHCFDTLEEGGTFRRRTTEATSSLSVAQNSGDLPGFHASVVAHRFCDARVRGRVSMHSLGTSCAAACSTESPGQSYAPSSRTGLRPSSPLRTVRESFPSH